jgi:hypothetical protein
MIEAKRVNSICVLILVVCAEPTRRFHFFENVEDAEFSAEAARRNWNLFGLDQEFSFSYVPLVERMYQSLSRKKQNELKALFDKSVSLFKTFYENEAKGGQPASIAIYDSKEINQFLEAAAKDNPTYKHVIT